MAGVTAHDIQNWFTYHPPVTDQAARYETIREVGKELAVVIERFCPDSRERSTALARLREAVMWANASIACNEGEIDAG